MSKITTADCKKFLDGHDAPFLARTESHTGLTRSDTWIRVRKYKDENGVVCRDFANTGIPAVVVLGEGSQGLEVMRHRALGIWEKAFRDHFENWYGSPPSYAWEEKVLWSSLTARDFAFGVGQGEVTEDEDGYYYFFQPVTVQASEPWDQHSAINHLFPSHITGDEICESTYTFSGNGANGNLDIDVTQDLIALGFKHDKKLDGISGS